MDSARIEGFPEPIDISNIDYSNRPNVYITARGDPSKDPDWILSDYGIPDENRRSQSEVVIVHVDKSDTLGAGIADVFYFFFYSFNLGNQVGLVTSLRCILKVRYSFVGTGTMSGTGNIRLSGLNLANRNMCMSANMLLEARTIFQPWRRLASGYGRIYTLSL
jgi:hypothetical protein